MNTDVNAPLEMPRDPSLALPDSGREELLRGPLLLVTISRVLSIPFYLLCALAATANLRRPTVSPADRFLLAGGLWVLALLSALLAWLYFSRRRAFRPLMSLFCALFLLLLAGVYLHYRHFAPVYGFKVTLGFGSGLIENALYLFIVSGFLWPFYYAFSPRAKRVFTR